MEKVKVNVELTFEGKKEDKSHTLSVEIDPSEMNMTHNNS
jgi:hypothetical protein